MVDVVDEPHGDAALLRRDQRAGDDLRRLVVEPDVVERELEARLRGAEELGDLVCDVDGGLAAVAVEPELDHAERGAQRGLVGALRRLVLGQRLGRVDVAEHRVVRDERLRHRVAVAPREHRRERLHLHLAEARQRLDPPLQVGGVRGVAPDAACVAAVLLGDDGAQLLHALGHVAREAMDRRLLAEDLERAGPGRVPAISAASRPPSRCFSLSGPANAVGTVTC